MNKKCILVALAAFFTTAQAGLAATPAPAVSASPAGAPPARETEEQARDRSLRDGTRRWAPVPKEQWTAEQQEAVEYYRAARKNDPKSGIFMDLLRVPDMMQAAFRMRLYVQQKISFGEKLSQLGMLVTLRQWGQKQEWSGHAVEAVRYGLKPEIVYAIAEGRYPPGMDDDEALIYNYCYELLYNHNVSDATYDHMVRRFGEQGAVEGILLVSVYSVVGMTLNVAREPVPAGRPDLPDFPQMKSIPLSMYSNLPPTNPGFALPPARPASPPPVQKTFGK
jgi:4-carboxymuconolactone decarboxylase